VGTDHARDVAGRLSGHPALRSGRYGTICLVDQGHPLFPGGKGSFRLRTNAGDIEPINGVFGIEEHLANLLLYEEELRLIYQRQVEWTVRFIHNCLDLGVDMIHIPTTGAGSMACSSVLSSGGA